MKKIKKILIILSLILIIILTIILLPKGNKNLDDNIEVKNTNSGMLSIMLGTEIGGTEYVESTITSFPQKYYSFNPKLSKCINGSKLKYNDDTKTVHVETSKTDKCYAYFDKAVGSENFDFKGSYDTFTAPLDGTYKIELWGAQGSSYDSDHQGGKGGYVSGTIKLKKNDTLYVYVGGHPADRSETAGYNGGGTGFSKSQSGYAGGGATDVRLVKGEWNSTEGLNSRIMVAAGGGGTGISITSYTLIAVAGNAGGVIGYDGDDTKYHTQYAGTGATQVAGGYNPDSNKNNGGFGYGGYDDYHGYGGCAGGGGYYGGGTANRGHGGGGGGSSYISGHTGCVAITSATDRTPKSGCTTSTTSNACSIHYSNYKFSETVMIDGLGYSWSNVIGQQTTMPKPDGGTEVGHTGNGYARITLIK